MPDQVNLFFVKIKLENLISINLTSDYLANPLSLVRHFHRSYDKIQLGDCQVPSDEATEASRIRLEPLQSEKLAPPLLT